MCKENLHFAYLITHLLSVHFEQTSPNFNTDGVSVLNLSKVMEQGFDTSIHYCNNNNASKM